MEGCLGGGGGLEGFWVLLVVVVVFNANLKPFPTLPASIFAFKYTGDLYQRLDALWNWTLS